MGSHQDEAIKFLDSSPYDYRFMKQGGIPFLLVYKGETHEDIPSMPIPIDNGVTFEGYFLDEFGLAEIE